MPSGLLVWISLVLILGEICLPILVSPFVVLLCSCAGDFWGQHERARVAWHDSSSPRVRPEAVVAGTFGRRSCSWWRRVRQQHSARSTEQLSKAARRGLTARLRECMTQGPRL